jgi:DNA-binding CsgD family transcriptional regulator
VSVLIALGVLLLFGAKVSSTGIPIAPGYLVVICVATIAIGIVLQEASWVYEEVNLVVFAVSVLFISVGSALVLLQWGTVFSSVGLKMMLVEVSAGYLIAIAMIVPYSLLPAMLRVGYLVSATIVNGVLLARSLRQSEVNGLEEATAPIYKNKLFVRICIGLFFCGMGIGLSSVVFRFAENALSLEGSVLRLIGGTILITVAICIAIYFRKGMVAAEYRFTYLMVVMGTLLSLVMPSDSPVNTVVLFTASTSIMIVSATILLDLVHRRLYHPARAISIGVASIILGNLSVRCIFAMLNGLDRVSEIPYTVLVVILAAVFIAADSLFLIEKTLLSFEFDNGISLRAGAQPGEVLRQSKIASFEKAFGLTQREQEVFRLLIAGRSSRRIQEELFISESTANTHIHHIYTKADIHSRQELLDIMEDREPKDAIRTVE